MVANRPKADANGDVFILGCKGREDVSRGPHRSNQVRIARILALASQAHTVRGQSCVGRWTSECEEGWHPNMLASGCLTSPKAPASDKIAAASFTTNSPCRSD
jgi:hypothetical protein